jgi:hypothetical protein
MKNIIIILVFLFVLVSCATVKDKIPKIPKFEKKTCDGSKDTLADVFCKKN